MVLDFEKLSVRQFVSPQRIIDDFMKTKLYKQISCAYNGYFTSFNEKYGRHCNQRYVHAVKAFSERLAWTAFKIFTILFGTVIIGLQIWLAALLTFLSWTNSGANLVKRRTVNVYDTFMDILRRINENCCLHTFVDVISSVVDRMLGIRLAVDPPDYTVTDRIKGIIGRMYTVADAKAGFSTVGDSAQKHIANLTQYLNDSLTLMKSLRSGQSWFDSKLGNVQDSATNFKAYIENEARTLHEKPEKILLKSIRQLSNLLVVKLNVLVNSDEGLLNYAAREKINYVKTSFAQFDSNINSINNLNEFSEEVLVNFQNKLNEICHLNSLFKAHSDAEQVASNDDSADSSHDNSTENYMS